MLAPGPGWPQRLQWKTNAVAATVVGQALVGQAGGRTAAPRVPARSSGTAHRSASLNLGFRLRANVFGL